MKKSQRENMLLFSKERAFGPNRYRLYFTPVSSIGDETPRVFRLLVRTPFSFARFMIGHVYSLTYSKIYINKFEQGEEFALQETDYTRLLQTRDFKFIDKKTSAALRLMEKPATSMDRYYTFDETRQIVNYRPDFLTRVAIKTFSSVVLGVALLVPFCIYAYMLYQLIRGQIALVGFSSKSLILPILGIGALPLTMFLMSALFVLGEFLLLRIDFTKWSMLKKYTLEWGGVRKSIFFEPSDIDYLKKFGIISGAALAVSILIALFV